MEKAVKLFTTALALWLSAATLANSAGLLEEQSKYNRAKHVASARTTKLSASAAQARADALLGFRYEHGLGVPQSFRNCRGPLSACRRAGRSDRTTFCLV